MVDMSINLGQAAITVSVSLLGWAVRKAHQGVVAHLKRIDTLDARLEMACERVDDHSEAIDKAGLRPRGQLRWRPISRKRRSGDWAATGE